MEITNTGSISHTGTPHHASSTAAEAATQSGSVSKKDGQKYSLASQLVSVENTIVEINKKITILEKSVPENKKHLARIKEIAKKHGVNTFIRYKEIPKYETGYFKKGYTGSFLKRFLHGERYQQERAEAAKYFGLASEKITAAEALHIINQKTESAPKEIKQLKAELEALKNEHSPLYREEMRQKSKLATQEKIQANKIAQTKADKNNYKLFSTIYQSNKGSEFINHIVRRMRGNNLSLKKIKADDIIEEYWRSFSNNIKDKEFKEIKQNINSAWSSMEKIAIFAAEHIYRPRKNDIITFRGQGMTSKGFDKLKTQYHADQADKKNTVYQFDQFVSTSSDKSVAEGFAKNSPFDVKVMIKITGNSSCRLNVADEVRFMNNENEHLYSPLACFIVEDIKGNTITLREVNSEVTNNLQPQSFPV